MQPLITLKDIGRKYVIGSEIIHALKSVTLTIKKGEFVALMGPWLGSLQTAVSAVVDIAVCC